jgi:hypothetical protein
MARPKSRSFGFRRAQNGRERALLQFLAHAFAGVLEFHGDMRWLRIARGNERRFDGERAAVGHGFGGVENQIQKRLFQLRRVAHHGGKSGCKSRISRMF